MPRNLRSLPVDIPEMVPFYAPGSKFSIEPPYLRSMTRLGTEYGVLV